MKLPLLAASFALTAYAGLRLLDGDWPATTLWLLGAALLHDLLLLPLYSTLDRSAVRLLGPRVTYLRVPAYLSALLLLVFLPLILRRSPTYERATLHSLNGYLWRWLLLTAALFTLSAAWYALRSLRSPSTTGAARPRKGPEATRPRA
ncbi:hypothetical protein ACFQLX_24055 [Streptomyces polyrhachis]|uniref:Lipoprotein n=1 Tax=Streptomyces polyrhachis TaxID=1282885 RepID=A0ABW2GQ90_9ACTN